MRTSSLLIPGLALLLTGCIEPWPYEDEEIIPFDARVAFVYPDTAGDHGWTKTHEDARLYLEDHLGLETTRQELVGAADVEDVIADFVADEWNFHITTASTYISATQQASIDWPDSYFLSVSGSVSGDNLRSFYGRMYHPMYISGYLAAQMSCTGHLGMVGKFPIPRQVSHVNAFTLGAQLADPDVVVDVRWIGTTSETGLEEELTLDLIAQGADVILAQTNTSVPVETAEGQFVTCNVEGEDVQSEVYSIGFNNPDACLNGPERCLTSNHWNWGPMYAEAIESISDGSWADLDISFMPMTNDASSTVSLADLSTFIPGTIRTSTDELRVQVVNGDLAVPFVGPVYDNEGTLRLSDGESLTDEEIGRLCWFTDGIVTTEEGELEPAVVPESCVGDH